MANFFFNFLVALFCAGLGLWRFEGVFAVDDFTCVTKPRVPLNAEESFIAGLFVNFGGTLSIARTQYTYTTGTLNQDDRSLPGGSTLDPTAVDGDVSVSILQMPASGGVSRIGVYACQATSTGGVSTSIGTVIMSTEADFLPTAISQTVNSGDTVRLAVTATGSRTDTRWRLDSSDPPYTGSSNNLYYDIQDASSTHAGTYEVHPAAGARSEGKQALMRLLVRECGRGRWSTPSCNKDCPVCFNGGVCDDVSGLCICPPGFSGDLCEIVLGPNRFGKDGSLRCDSGLLPGTTSCEGMLFCLPDPFGCICAAGYQGIDCNTECDDGTFGANCAQMCHCSGGATCDKTTGRCPGNNCAQGYKGISCQDSCGAGFGGLNCATSCEVPAVVTLFRDVSPSALPSEIHLAWKFVSNLCAVERYQVTYKLTNQDQCQEDAPQRVEVTSDLYADNLIISSGLLPFSSYTVYIKAWNEIGAGPETSISVTTGETVPTGQPENVISSNGQTNSLSFTWDPIPCASRHTYITYHYNLQQKDNSTDVREGEVASAAVTLYGLLPCTVYVFQVAGVTSVGQGPYSTFLEASTMAQDSVKLLEAAAMSDPTQVVVSWLEPNGDCPIDDYRLEYNLTNRDQCNNTVVSGAMKLDNVQSPTTITGLYPHSTYSVSVKAANSGLIVSHVSTEVITLGSAPSGPPRDIKSTLITNTTLSFSWDQPECGSRNGLITQYSYTLTNSVDGTVISNTISTTSLDLTDLVPFTVYTLSVAAMNSIGFGPVAVISNQTDEGTMTLPRVPTTEPSSVLTIVIFVVIVAVGIIVLGLLVYFLRLRKQRRQQPPKDQGPNDSLELVSYDDVLPREEKATSSSDQKRVCLAQESVYEPVDSGSSPHHPSPEPMPTYEDVGLPTWAHPWSILWDDLMVGNKVLGNGQFGEVHYGVVTVKGELCKAAIKKLKENASPADRENFLKEFKTMTLHGSHPNLVRVLGACQHEGILYVASEYLPIGDLRCFLRKARSMDDDSKSSLSSQKLLQFALDVAKGMQHLAASGVIHRDLAARNILLDDDLVAKVSDFGLSRGEDVYVQTSKTRVPIRWLSLESLTRQTYTSKSDVWSFGILLWEIATLGGTPYPGIKTQFLTSRLENGYRMPKPINSDDKIYDVMLQCWQEDPNDRPSFKKLVSILETMADSHAINHTYMRLLPSSEKYLYVNIHPEFDDN